MWQESVLTSGVVVKSGFPVIIKWSANLLVEQFLNWPVQSANPGGSL